MASVLIQVLGGFRLTVAGRVVSSLPRKAQALLAYLAVQDGRPATRDTVSDLLWTDRGAEQARHSLRQTLLVLRRELPDVIGGMRGRWRSGLTCWRRMSGGSSGWRDRGNGRT